MSRDSSGNYSLPAGNPVIAGDTIEASWANTTMDDVANALTNSLDRTGKGGLLAPLLFTDGTVGLPSISFTAEPTSGFYRAATGDIRLSVGGVAQFQQTAAATTLTQQLVAPSATVAGTVTANTSVVTPLATITTANITNLNATTAVVPNATVSGTLTVGDIQGTTATIGTIDSTTYLINGFNYTSVILTAVNDAETAAAAALVSQNAAAASAGAASTSETNAAASASAASTSATNAGTSATNAAASATAADASATAAAASAASTVGDAAAAAASAAAALVSEGNAATSETNAAASALAASNSETAAAGSAAAASGSATAAAGSATAADTSATNAAASEAAAAASFDSFDDRYLGAKAVPPTLDNDGNALIVGALYFDSVTSFMKVWDGAAWLDAFTSITGQTLDQVTTTGNTTTNSITVGGLTSSGVGVTGLAGVGERNIGVDASGNLIEIGAGGLEQVIASTNQTAVAGNIYFFSTAGGARTLTLPASPSAGDQVGVADYAGTFGTNNLTVARNATNIVGLAENLVMDLNNAAVTFQYVDATQGWRVI